MTFILAIGGADDQQIAYRQHLAVGGFVRKHAQPSAHIEFPDGCGCGAILAELFSGARVARSVAEVAQVETTELALGGDIVEVIVFHIRCTRRRRQEELSKTALHPRGLILPEELAVRSPKGHEDTAFLTYGGVDVPCVVRAHVDRIARNHWTAKRLVPQLDTPNDVPTTLGIPVKGRNCRQSRDDLWLGC